MNKLKEADLKKLYTEKLKAAGYQTVPELAEILPQTIQSITGATAATAEKIFVAALKSHMKNIQLKYKGQPPEGITKALTDMGFMSIHEVADANPSIIANALGISLSSAGDIVLFAMELMVGKEKTEVRLGENFLEEIDKEISYYLGQLDRTEKKQRLQFSVSDALERIHETIKLPGEEPNIEQTHKEKIDEVLAQFTIVFPACTGFGLFNRKGVGVYSFSQDDGAKKNLAKINETFNDAFWKISLLLEDKDEYGWINLPPHLVWLEAIRDRKQKRLLAFVGAFLFEEGSEGVGNATPTIKGIMKEIARIIFGPEN